MSFGLGCRQLVRYLIDELHSQYVAVEATHHHLNDIRLSRIGFDDAEAHSAAGLERLSHGKRSDFDIHPVAAHLGQQSKLTSSFVIYARLFADDQARKSAAIAAGLHFESTNLAMVWSCMLEVPSYILPIFESRKYFSTGYSLTNPLPP